MNFKPSSEQREILEYIKNGKGNLTIPAPAGSGKSSTLLYLMNELSNHKKMTYLVFNTAMLNSMKRTVNSNNNKMFPNINKDNIELYTFHGYMRKILGEKMPEIAYDFKSNSFSSVHLKQVLNKMELPYQINPNTLQVLESFNEYAKKYLQSTINLPSFLKEKEYLPIVNENVLKDLVPLIKAREINLASTSENYNSKLVKEFYDTLLIEIFYNSAIDENMTHDIYYKYAYENYGQEDLFLNSGIILLDEGQDLDPLMNALISTSETKIVKVGDFLQQLYKFRGLEAFNSKSEVTIPLTTSYRLQPIHALYASAYSATKLEDVNSNQEAPQVYGYQRVTSKSIGEQKPQEHALKDYIQATVERISNNDIMNHPLYLAYLQNKEEIDSSIIKGCTTKLKASVSKFNKDKDYLSLLDAILSNTNYFAKNQLFGLDEDGTNSSNISMTAEEIENKLLSEMQRKEFGEAHKLLNSFAKTFSHKFTKKELSELLVDDNVAFLSKDNKNLLSSAYELIKSISQNLNSNESDVAQYQIKLATSLSSKFDDLAKGNTSSLDSKEIAMFLNGLGSLKTNIYTKDNFNMSILDLREILKKENIKNQFKFLFTIMSDESKAETFTEIKTIKIGEKGYSLKDLGISHIDILENMKRAIDSFKRKNKVDEVSPEDLMNAGYFKTFDSFFKLDNYILNNFNLGDIEETKNQFLKNFFQYIDIKDTVAKNTNINLVGESSAFNLYFGTVHQSKGLEFNEVFLSNDIGRIQEDNEELGEDEKLNMLYLVYVAITRQKEKLYFEEGSNVYKELNLIIDSEIPYTRQYISDNKYIVQETLGSVPSFKVNWRDTLTFEDKSIQMEFYENSIFPSYKNLAIIIDNNDNVVDFVVIKDDNLKNLNKEYHIKYLHPDDQDNTKSKEIIKSLSLLHEEHIKELEEANYVF